MNLADTLQSLRRRWYVVAAGVVAAVAIAFVAWTHVSPTYTRSATELLLPGADYVPTGDNPYLYLGGLGQAADVVVSALNSETIVDEFGAKYPGIAISVGRDPVNSGPAIDLHVTASSDRYTGPALKALVAQLSASLTDIQSRESVPVKNRITATSISMDGQSTVANKPRELAAGGAAIATVVVSMIVAALIDGLDRRRRRGARAGRARSAWPAGEAADSLDGLGIARIFSSADDGSVGQRSEDHDAAPASLARADDLRETSQQHEALSARRR